MRTELLKIKAIYPEPSKVERVARALQRGEIVGIPTETVYGLAANAEDETALTKLRGIKKRPDNKPFTIQIASFLQIKDYAEKVSPELELILKEFWPGALTVIVAGKKGKAGLRMPDNKVALSVIRKAGVPLAVTSANISGEPSVSSAKDAFEIFNGTIGLIVDDGTLAGGVESTVLNSTTSPFEVLRKGSVSDRLEGFLKQHGQD